MELLRSNLKYQRGLFGNNIKPSSDRRGFRAFRNFICSTLGKRPELQIVDQVSDGLQAVRRAEELRPDLIVLDIGIPSLNGIEAARRIRKLSPESKISCKPRIVR